MKWFAIPLSSGYIWSELSTMTHPSWVALHGMAHSFTELDKAVVSVWLVFCDCGFHSVCRFPGGSEVKASACNAGDRGSIPGLGRSPGEGNGNPLQCSCLENPMGEGA